MEKCEEENVEKKQLPELKETTNESELAGEIPIVEDPSDDELDSILDSALDDFKTQDESLNESVKEASAKLDDTTKSAAKQPHSVPMPGDDVLQALLGGLTDGTSSEDFDNQLKSLFHDDPIAMAEFNKLSSSGAAADASQAQKQFADTLAETLGSLSKNAESLQSELSDDDLMKQFEQSLNLGGGASGAVGGQGQADFIPMMQNMMHNLLSKDVLYPSLKDLSNKYPEWLSEHNGKIEKDKFQNYSKQFTIVSDLVSEYDSEQPGDSQQVKDERFERILDLMTQMQDCGPPPKEIIGELAPGLNFDSDGNPVLPGAEQCSIM